MAYSFAQLESFAIQGGFPASLAPTMAAIAMAESSGNNVIQKGQPYSTTGWGLWQITPGNSVPQFGVDNALLNPVNNAKAAHAKWVSQGLGAWTTYTSGAFRRFMQGNVPPANDNSSGGGGGTGPSNPGVNNTGLSVPDPLSGVSDAINSFDKSLEHIFDVALNNSIYAAVVISGLALMGGGLVLMLAESSAGVAAMEAAGGVTGGVAKVGGVALRHVGNASAHVTGQRAGKKVEARRATRAKDRSEYETKRRETVEAHEKAKAARQ